MIYMVEHIFDGPGMEADWNTWYQQNIVNLLTVPGITTAQRFKVVDTSPPRYMAMYTVSSTEPFESAAYKAVGGGGNASVGFRPAYKYWRRNLFESPGPAPAVAESQVLSVIDREEKVERGYGWMTRLPCPQSWVMMAGLPPMPAFRGLAVTAASAPAPDAEIIYTPITAQLRSR